MATKQTQNIDLGLTRNENNRPARGILTLETSKAYRGGVESDAKVMWHGTGFRVHAFGLGGGGDFSKTLARNTTAKATQKAIDTLHAQTFTPETIAALTAEVLAYYAEGKDKR